MVRAAAGRDRRGGRGEDTLLVPMHFLCAVHDSTNSLTSAAMLLWSDCSIQPQNQQTMNPKI